MANFIVRVRFMACYDHMTGQFRRNGSRPRRGRSGCFSVGTIRELAGFGPKSSAPDDAGPKTRIRRVLGRLFRPVRFSQGHPQA